MINNARMFRSLLVILAAVVFSGCATLPKETDRTALLKEAAEQYWKLRFEDNYKGSYEMEDKSVLPEFELYRVKASRMKRFSLTSYAIDKVDIEGDKGRVSVGIVFYLQDVSAPFRQTLFEDWVFKEGKWLHRFPAE